jgi:transmembrane sensor
MKADMSREDAIEAEAFEWTKRIQHPSFADWEALDAWLEVDRRHAELFNRLASLDDEVAEGVRELRDHPIRPAPPMQPPQSLRPRLPARPTWRSAGRLAASLALVVGLGAIGLGLAWRTAPGARSSTMAIVTAAGQRRSVRLADGTLVTVAGGTRLLVDAAAHRAELDEGQATFSVVHDPNRRFAVRLGQATVVDVGTVFDLRRREGRNTIAVAQGEVRVEGLGAPVELAAGRRLRFDGATTEFAQISPNAATAWQAGRFNYVDAPISDVIDDIAQTTGARVRVAPQIANRRFSGSMAIQGDAGEALRNVAPAMDLTVAREGDVWVLHPAHDPL